MQAEFLKIFVLGDFYAAKCFLHRLVCNEVVKKEMHSVPYNFPLESHAPTYLLDNDKSFTLQFWHINGGEDFGRLRPLSYPNSDLFIVLFDVSKRSSFEDISNIKQEVKYHMPKAPILFIATKVHSCQDIDNENVPVVTMTEARDMAKSLGSLCIECCPVSGEGVEETAHTIVRLAVYGQDKRSICKRRPQKRQKNVFPVDLVIDPSGYYGMDNAPKCPSVHVLATTSVEDLARMRDDTTCTDVRFTFQDSPLEPIEAHQVILISAAPELFQEIFTGTTKSCISGRPQELFEKVSWPSPHAENSNNNDMGEMHSKRMVEIRVCDKVARKDFYKLLEFLYVGAHTADLKKDDSIHELITIAKMFSLTELLDACENVLEGNEKENIRRPCFVGGGKATVLKEVFFNKPLLDDLVFQVQGNVIYSHQAVIIARSRTLAVTIADYRRNHPQCIRVKVVIDDVSMETFMGVLEYLYTDDVQRDLELEVLLDLLRVASGYHLQRLVTLCEYLLIVELQDTEHNALGRVVDVLLVAKKHSAQNLIEWCLNLIARNYARFESSREIARLNKQDKEYVEIHQWPPKCTLSVESGHALSQYLTERKDENQTSCCVVM